MLPAPTRIAATPIPSSRGCWNPAVPPPPVGGAAVGVAGGGLVGGVVGGLVGGVVGGLVGGVVGGLVGGVVGGLVGGVVGGLVLEPAEPADVAEVPVVDDDVGSAPDGAFPEHAEMAMEASMARMPQPMAVNLALSPVPEVAACPFTEPPHASGEWRARFPVPYPRKRRGP
jgi:hypothetical protein